MSTKSDKYVGRTVEENGTDRFGDVTNAWDEPEGVVGLYVIVGYDAESDRLGGEFVTSDSEHWTIRPDRRSEQEKLNAGAAAVSAYLGRLLSF